MSVTSDTFLPVPRRSARPASRGAGPATTTSRSDHDAEVLARRALGSAMSLLYGGGSSVLAAHEASLVARARALLEDHVPEGPELTLALELLDGAATTSHRAPRG